MIFNRIKCLFFIGVLSIMLVSCKESVETPPFSFVFTISIIDQNGNSLLQKHKDKIKEIAVSILEPSSGDIHVNVTYVEISEYLGILISEPEGGVKNGGNRLQDYILQIQYPEVFSNQEKDIIRIRYQFKNYYPNAIEAFYNDKKPKSLDTMGASFEIVVNE